MDKEKAARMLTKELGDKLGRSLVGEESYKRSLIECASAKYQLSNPILVSYEEGTFSVKKNIGQHTSNDLVELVMSYSGAAFTEANYYFSEAVPVVRSGYSTRCHALFSVTPYALIGEKEKSELRRLFYKNVPLEIVNSMNLLGIDHFIGLYLAYQQGELYCPDMPADKILEDINVLKKFINKASSFSYDKDDEVSNTKFEQFGSIGSLNDVIKRLGIDAEIRIHEVHNNYVHKSCISKVLSKAPKVIERINSQYYGTVSNEFINFVFFSLPSEEQNIASNKRILKSSLNSNFVVNVLSKEYAENGPFREYFDVLSQEMQDNVFKAVKNTPKRNTVCDSFLWSKGFKELKLNHVELYKSDSKGFIEYFPDKSIEEKKVILKDIMECDSINEEVVKWLNENCLDLLREVGFNG